MLNRNTRIAAIVVFCAICAEPASAQQFGLQVGPPAAAIPQAGTASTPKKLAKDSVFVVRSIGCVDPAGARLVSTAEGLVNGVRRSVPLQLMPMPSPGVHAVPRAWPEGGTWIVTLAGTCDGKTAGAIVSMGMRTVYDRTAVTRLAHRPTGAEIDGALNALVAAPQAPTQR